MLGVAEPMCAHGDVEFHGSWRRMLMVGYLCWEDSKSCDQFATEVPWLSLRDQHFVREVLMRCSRPHLQRLLKEIENGFPRYRE